MKGSVLKAALMGGILCGTANSVLQPMDCCCLVWGALGGAFAAWVLLSDSDGLAGAFRCLLASIMAGAVTGLISLPLSSLFGRLLVGEEEMLQEARRLLDAMGAVGGEGLPADQADAIIRGWQFVEFNVWSVVALMIVAALMSFPSFLGGIAGLVLFRRPNPPSQEGTVLFGEGAVRPDAPGEESRAPQDDSSGPWTELPPDDGPQGEGEIPHEDLPSLSPEPPESVDDRPEPPRGTED